MKWYNRTAQGFSPISVKLSEVAAGSAQPQPSSEGRCIRRFQVYGMSAQTDRLLVWR
jgi:hypothetical protein